MIKKLIKHMENTMKKICVFLCFLALIGCKPKGKQLEQIDSDKGADFLTFSQRVALGERIVKRHLGARYRNPVFDSFYHSIGDNDGYVCGKIQWNDARSQTTKENSYFVYVSFTGSKVASNSQPTLFENGQDWAREKYRLLCFD